MTRSRSLRAAGVPRTVCGLILSIALLAVGTRLSAQQFSGDNQWVAPHGVATLIGGFGEEFSQVYLTGALLPEWEFTAQFIHYYEDPRDASESYTTANLYAKRRLSENAAGTAGYAVMGGTGLFPQHVERGEVAPAFETWWAQFVATYSFLDDRLLLDFLPGATVDLDDAETGGASWGFLYSTRAAIYPWVPTVALVAEVFGTAGDEFAPAQYRAGLRWESEALIVSGTFSALFEDASEGPGFELGVRYFTAPWACFGGCEER